MPAGYAGPLAIEIDNPNWGPCRRFKTRVVSVHDKPVRLTRTEYCIFELLSVHKGAIATKQMLLDHVYDGMHAPELKIIDVFVCNLRKKLAQATGGNHYIETVWGRGYMLRDPAAPAATRKRPR